MALKINIYNKVSSELIKSVLGIESVTEIYIKVIRYGGEGNICRFTIGFFHNREINDVPIQDSLGFPELSYQFQIDQTGSELDVNPVKQAYEYLKTLSQYQECDDC